MLLQHTKSIGNDDSVEHSQLDNWYEAHWKCQCSAEHMTMRTHTDINFTRMPSVPKVQGICGTLICGEYAWETLCVLVACGIVRMVYNLGSTQHFQKTEAYWQTCWFWSMVNHKRCKRASGLPEITHTGPELWELHYQSFVWIHQVCSGYVAMTGLPIMPTFRWYVLEIWQHYYMYLASDGLQDKQISEFTSFSVSEPCGLWVCWAYEFTESALQAHEMRWKGQNGTDHKTAWGFQGDHGNLTLRLVRRQLTKLPIAFKPMFAECRRVLGLPHTCPWHCLELPSSVSKATSIPGQKTMDIYHLLSLSWRGIQELRIRVITWRSR